MDEDTQDAAWHQLELESQREDELLKRLRKTCGSFRADCDEFHAAFQHTNRNLNYDRPQLDEFRSVSAF
jgi:hypothetical protein